MNRSNIQTTNANWPKKQRGAALIVSMLMLIIMTLIGVTSMRTTVMEERMTSNERNRSIAMHATESALRDAERTVAELEHISGFGALPGEVEDNENEPDFFNPAEWNDVNSVEASNRDHIASAGAPARTITKLLGRNAEADGALNTQGYGETQVSPGITNFRVTGRGLGGDTRAEVLIQTHVGARVRFP